MQSTIGNSSPLNCVISPKCFMLSLPFLLFSRTKSTPNFGCKFIFPNCSTQKLCGSLNQNLFVFAFCAVFKSSDAFTVRIMPEPEWIQWASRSGAKLYFLCDKATAVEALRSDCFQRCGFHVSYPPAESQNTFQQSLSRCASHPVRSGLRPRCPVAHTVRSGLFQTRWSTPCRVILRLRQLRFLRR